MTETIKFEVSESAILESHLEECRIAYKTHLENMEQIYTNHLRELRNEESRRYYAETVGM